MSSQSSHLLSLGANRSCLPSVHTVKSFVSFMATGGLDVKENVSLCSRNTFLVYICQDLPIVTSAVNCVGITTFFVFAGVF